MLQVAGFLEHSTVNGQGLRSVLFVSGCHHACVGCHNQAMQDANYGEQFTVDTLYKRILKNQPIIEGVTFSGGEPFEQPQALADLAIRLKAVGLNIWCYSGYTYETLKVLALSNPSIDALLKEIDVLVDGPFIKDLADANLKFRGSSNQHIYALSKGNIVDTLDNFFI